MTSARHGQLTSCRQLADELKQVSVIDCRFDLGDPAAGHGAYLNGHIPGAIFVDLNQDLSGPVTAISGRHPLPKPQQIAARLGELGVRRDKPVVVYDAGNGAIAARAWWILRWLGHQQVSLLDGGLQYWQQLGLSLEKGERSPEPCVFSPVLRNERVVTTQELLAAGDKIADLNLLDARDAARFRGDVEPIDAVAGHIPGSANLPFPVSLADSGLWRSDTELEALWREQMRGDPETPLVVMCGSGLTACHLALSALQAGCREPRLYVGSWSEWIRDPERQIAVGEG